MNRHIIKTTILALIMLLPAALMAVETTDHSSETAIVLPEPVFATVCMTGIDAMPVTKHDDLKAWLEFDDGAGNTFRKRVILNAQGNSSMRFDKKNIAVDFCEDEWKGDETTDITFGKWVTQDGFHLKAYYNDYYRGMAVAAYHLYDDIENTLPFAENRPWKRSRLSGEEIQTCHPDGFPCAVYLNGEFYGVFSWQLKKHRKNMNMDKSEANHIHLDGILWNSTLFGGEIDWTQFEIRNPKTLYCMDGTAYDGDNPKELIDESSDLFSLGTDNEKTRKGKLLSAKVKASLRQLADFKRDIESQPTLELKREKVMQHFDLTSLIDYYIFSLVTNNYDGFAKNWQWITYDGKRWAVEPYDLDGTFGQMFSGEVLLPPEWGFIDDDFTMVKEYVSFGPAMYVLDYFSDELHQRYAELRDGGVITVDAIHQHVSQWASRIPAEYMQQEWSRWPDCGCANPSIPNNGWHQVNDYTGWINLPEYNADDVYEAGTRVTINHYWNMSVWEAEHTIRGVFPYQRVGYTMTLESVREWLTRKLQLVDGFMAYGSGSGISHTSPAPAPTVATYSIDGIRQDRCKRGINIVKDTNGTIRKHIYE